MKFVLQALEELNGSNLDGATLEVSLAKPPSDKKKKEEILRARERRMFTNMQGRAFGQLIIYLLIYNIQLNMKYILH